MVCTEGNIKCSPLYTISLLACVYLLSQSKTNVSWNLAACLYKHK